MGMRPTSLAGNFPHIILWLSLVFCIWLLVDIDCSFYPDSVNQSLSSENWGGVRAFVCLFVCPISCYRFHIILLFHPVDSNATITGIVSYLFKSRSRMRYFGVDLYFHSLIMQRLLAFSLSVWKTSRNRCTESQACSSWKAVSWCRAIADARFYIGCQDLKLIAESWSVLVFLCWCCDLGSFVFRC